MNFTAWTKEMSVGRADLDGHHQMIIDCLNRLHPLIDCVGREREILDVLDILEDFVLIHFSEEERIMKAAGYPDWQEHKILHDQMYELVFRMKADVTHCRLPDAHQLFKLLYDWFVQHIMGEDRKYMAYLEHPVPAGNIVWTRRNGRPF